MSRVFVIVISFLSISLGGLCHNGRISAEIEGWNAWAVLTLFPVEILTPLQKLSFVFFSHCDSRTIIVFTPNSPTTIAIPLQKIFFSHIDAASQAILEEIAVDTIAKPLKTVYVSHYDAITYIVLSIPVVK